MAAASGDPAAMVNSVAACPEYRELLAVKVTALLDSYRDDELPEAVWQAALGAIDRATARTREWAWWKARPSAELARLRSQLDAALEVARLAADLQEAVNAAEWEEGAMVRELAEQAGRARRRAQTLPAERARLAKRRAASGNPTNGKV